jgi:Leucine-rich repeat (LRR) protein
MTPNVGTAAHGSYENQPLCPICQETLFGTPLEDVDPDQPIAPAICPECKGSGFVGSSVPCGFCGGSGTLPGNSSTSRTKFLTPDDLPPQEAQFIEEFLPLLKFAPATALDWGTAPADFIGDYHPPREVRPLADAGSYISVNVPKGETTGHIYEVVVERENLTTLPDSIRNLTYLEILTLRDCPLHEIPPPIQFLRQIKRLAVSRSQISVLSDWLATLTELRVLDLSGNSLAEVPDFIGDLINLERLDLSHNKLTALPQCLFRLKLEHLNIRGNKFHDFPYELGLLKSLDTLEVSLPEAPFQWGAPAVLVDYIIRGTLQGKVLKRFQASCRDHLSTWQQKYIS